MSKAKRVVDGQGRPYAVHIQCPGCKMSHVLPTQDTHPEHIGPRWNFNGDLERPTFSPSILARGAIDLNEPDETKDWNPDAICHSFVTDGRIQFLSDCTHALAGQTVDLPDLEST